MMRSLRPPTRAAPWPYDAVLIDAVGGRTGVMLVADPFDVESEKQREQTSVTPTDYSPSSRDPFVEGTRRFRNWVLGLGERLHTREGEQEPYYIADGVDTSCGGIAILGPESSTVTPSGAGSPSASAITKIVEWTGSPLGTATPRLFAICGQQVLINSGNPGTGADWSVSKDFGTYPTVPSAGLTVTPSGLIQPLISSVIPTGADNGVTWGYKVQAIDSGGNTRSIISAEVTTVNGATNLVTATDYNTITWAAIAGAIKYRIYLTTAGPTINGAVATTGLLATVNAPTVTYQHDTANGGAAPQAATTGSTTWKYKVVAQGTFDPPHSGASTEFQTTAGGAELSSGIYNTIAWTGTSAAKYQVWRTSAGGTPATIGNLGATAAVTLNDIGQAPSASTLATTPPSASRQTPTDLHAYNFGVTPYLFAGMDYGVCWYYDGSTWTEHGSTGAYFTHAGGTFYRASINEAIFDLVTLPTALYPPTVLYSTIITPAVTSSWTAVDDSNQPITGLFALDQAVVIASQTELFLADGESLTPFASGASSDNGRNLVQFGGHVYARFGSSWYRITITSASTGTAEEVGLGRFLENISSVKGVVSASAGHNTWFNYFTVYNGTDTYLCKYGSWLSPEQTSTQRWEFTDHLHGAITKWTGRRAYSALVSTISGTSTFGNPRLLIGMDNGTFRIITLPLYSPFPPSDSSCRYQLTGSLELGIDDFGFGANEKNYHRATVLGLALTSTKTASLDYDVDGSGTYTALAGTFTSTGASITFPEDDLVQGHQLQLRLDLASSVNTATPQVDEVQLHAQVLGPTDEDGNPGFVRDRTLTVLCNEGLVDRKGAPIPLWSGQRLRNRLQAAASLGTCTLILPDGASRACSITEYHEGTVIGRDNERREVVRLKLTETALATSANADPTRMDPGWGPA